MSLAELVNGLLGRRKETEEDRHVVASSEPQILYATSQGKTRNQAERRLHEALPAPVGSEVYAQQPAIDIKRKGQKDWHGTASYQLVEGYEPPATVVEPDELVHHLTGLATEERQATLASTRQHPRRQARAAIASGTGYTPSALEQRLREEQLYS